MKSDFYVVLKWFLDILDDVVDFISDNWLLSLVVFVPIAGALIYFIFDGLVSDSEGTAVSAISFSDRLNSSAKGNINSSVRAFGSAAQKAKQASSLGLGIPSSRVHGSDVLSYAIKSKRASNKAKQKEAEAAQREQENQEKALQREQEKHDRDFNFKTTKSVYFRDGEKLIHSSTLNTRTGEIVKKSDTIIKSKSFKADKSDSSISREASYDLQSAYQKALDNTDIE